MCCISEDAKDSLRSFQWIATSTAMYLAHSLVSDASEPHSLSALLNHFDFHIILVPNPDGYVYTWEKDRLWYEQGACCLLPVLIWLT